MTSFHFILLGTLRSLDVCVFFFSFFFLSSFFSQFDANMVIKTLFIFYVLEVKRNVFHKLVLDLFLHQCTKWLILLSEWLVTVDCQ